MKKVLFSTVAMSALMLMATSCADDQTSDLKAGAESTVTITAQLPGDMGTRAFADGTKATELHYAVYEKGTTTRLAVCKKADGTKGQLEGTATMTGLQTTISLQLTTGKEYDFVFWADAPGDNVYTFNSENQTVTVNYANAENNTDNLDAFFGQKKALKVSGNMSISQELRRPFAQINIGTDDFDAAAAAGYTVSESTIGVATYKTLNLLSEEVSEPVTATFVKKPIPTEDSKFSVNSKDYKYLSMSYVLVPKDKETVDIAFDYTLTNRTFTNVPVQRNYRTNIYGSLLTNTANFNVVIAPGFNDPDNNYEVLNAKGVSQLKDLLASGADLSKKDVIVDLNGETMDSNIALNAHSVAVENGTVDASRLSAKAEEGVTLRNVKLTGSFPQNKINGNARVIVETAGDVVVDGLDYTGATDGYNPLEINLNNVVSKNVTVKNCKFANFSNNAMSVFGMAEGGVLNIEKNIFDLSKKSDAVRISNKTNTKFTINVKDCSYTYPDDAAGQWVGFFLFEDYTSATEDEANAAMQFKNLTVNVDNVTFEGAKVTELNLLTGARNQFACMCYDKLPSLVVTDATHFPTFNFK